MKAYMKTIPGIGHPNEDAFYANPRFIAQDGITWGLFMIADGMSGYNGGQASGLAINELRQHLQLGMQQMHPDEFATLIKNSIVKANDALQAIGTTYCTLDLLLASEQKAYLAHLGDSRAYAVTSSSCRQLTQDEVAGSTPANYLGIARINKVSLDDRINISIPYTTAAMRPRFMFLTTDGLPSRATADEITSILCAGCADYADPADVLESFSKIVDLPRQRLLELGEDAIRRRILYRISADKMPIEILRDIPLEDLANLVLENYRRKESSELCQNFDETLKFDDTTMILVDLGDKVARNLATLRQYETERIPQLTSEKDNLTASYARAEEKISQLEGKVASQQKDLAVRGQENTTLQEKVRTLEERVGTLEDTIETKENKLREYSERANTLVAETDPALIALASRLKPSGKDFVSEYIKEYLKRTAHDLKRTVHDFLGERLYSLASKFLAGGGGQDVR